ncbi:Signal transduction histidine kinase [Draconibacterium orientale]|uniref:histidine kinase n=1 Tax=Draconibacterium orientale TaxID=1168034 RepID=X5E2N7_9BACT|nr:hybrid sensor histidine kinase/response regulator [Draconibacterium orientale]AHW60856.1 histidine kinase [Draconibacterium orientale]SES66691.1 Signal transduction histidine kinase [Draconibacterium orientale]
MQKQTIICVDDEEIILEAIQEQLQSTFGEEYNIETSDSGEDALEFFKELMDEGQQVPVIISDYIMPGMKGDELLKEIHKLSPESLKILLTGQASIEGISNAINNAQLYRFIAKPWDKADLVLTVKEAVKSFIQEIKIRKQNKKLLELNASLEEQVAQRTEELREANAAKDKFFSIIAHDLKSPFNALLGLSDAMLENWEIFENEDKLEFVQDIHNTSKNTYALLQNLLEWSRSQIGSLQINPEVFNPVELVNENIMVLKQHVDTKQISITNKINNEVLCQADKNMISTVFRNLISNAIKFTNPQGNITITGCTKNEYHEFSVTDNGIGMNEKTKDDLFKLNSKTQRAGTSEESGTGLGLLLCKEFVEKNGGEIAVTSKENEGSTFSFTLPAAI